MKCKVNRSELLNRLKIAKKISGGIREQDAKLCYLEVDEKLNINTLRHGSQWYTGILDLDSVSEGGHHAVPVDDLLKVVDRLQTDDLTIRTLSGKIKIQGGKRYGTVPTLENEFPISNIGDDIVDGYEGPNTFAVTIRGLCSIGISDVSTVWGAVRIGDDGYGGATDSGNLLWTPLPLLIGTDREILVRSGALAPVANLIGDIKVRLSDRFLEVSSERGVYRTVLLDKDAPPYISLIQTRTNNEFQKFPLIQLRDEIDAFSKTVVGGAIVKIDDGKMTVSTAPGAIVEFSSTTEWDGDLKCQFFILPKNFSPVAKLLHDECIVFKGNTSHLILKVGDTIAMVSCLDGSLRFD